MRCKLNFEAERNKTVIRPGFLSIDHGHHCAHEFKMTTSKPEAHTTQPVNKIESRFRRLYLGFRWPPDQSINQSINQSVHVRYAVPSFSLFPILTPLVKFGTVRPYFGVCQCFTLLGVLENTGVAAIIAYLPCTQPELSVLPASMSSRW